MMNKKSLFSIAFVVFSFLSMNSAQAMKTYQVEVLGLNTATKIFLGSALALLATEATVTSAKNGFELYKAVKQEHLASIVSNTAIGNTAINNTAINNTAPRLHTDPATPARANAGNVPPPPPPPSLPGTAFDGSGVDAAAKLQTKIKAQEGYVGELNKLMAEKPADVSVREYFLKPPRK